MEKEALDELILKAQQETKTVLEQEIEALKFQKKELKEKLQINLEIEQKKEEIRALIEKLES